MPKNDIARQLAQIVNEMKAINSTLADMDSRWADPPDPDKPAVRQSLNDIKTQAAVAARYADAMLLKLG